MKLHLLYTREEFKILSDWQKKLFSRYVNIYYREYPEGRGLAKACMLFNNRYKFTRFTDAFINWLYYY